MYIWDVTTKITPPSHVISVSGTVVCGRGDSKPQHGVTECHIRPIYSEKRFPDTLKEIEIKEMSDK